MDEKKTFSNGGLLLLVGSIVTFLPTLFQILLGGVPEAPMFDSVRNMMLADKNLSHAYALASSVGLAMSFLFGLFAVNGAGLALIAHATSCNDSFHTMLSKVFAFVSVSAAVGFSISLFFMDPNEMSTIEPVFGILALFEFTRVAWGVSVGMKLREMK